MLTYYVSISVASICSLKSQVNNNYIIFIIGLMDIPVKNCIEPPTFRLLKRTDPIFVQALKKRLKEDPSGIGIPPLAVQCKDVRSKDLSEMRLKDVYRYEVFGGLHGVTAWQELNVEGFKFETISCHVYAGLTDEEALWLSSRHNANGQFQHRMTHRDYVHFKQHDEPIISV